MQRISLDRILGQEVSDAMLCQVYEFQLPKDGLGFGFLQLVDVLHSMQKLPAWRGIAQQVLLSHNA